MDCKSSEPDGKMQTNSADYLSFSTKSTEMCISRLHALSEMGYICGMEPYVVSFRKYRPQRFDSVVGQVHITSTLKNAIKSQQLAQAFLFCGPRGVGKTTCARIFAKTINCTNLQEDGEACDTCESCVSFNRGTSLAIHELDAASNNSVDDIRNLVDQVRYAPQGSKYKIYIIDEVHMLSTQAFNAFLKTLEEPPPYAIFILATTERHKILPTILSRCQIFDFNRIKVSDISTQLEEICKKEGIESEASALHIIAQKADGALRDALSIMDQIVSFSGGKLSFQAVIENLNIIDYEYYFKATEMLLGQQIAEVSLLFDDVISKGFEGINFIVGLAEHFRNLLMAKDPRTVRLLEQSDEVRRQYLKQTESTPAGFLLSALNIASHCEVNYKQSKHPRLLVELALMKMCFIQQATFLVAEGSAEKKKPIERPSPIALKGAPAASVVVDPKLRGTQTQNSSIDESNKTAVVAPTQVNTGPSVIKVSSNLSKTKAQLTEEHRKPEKKSEKVGLSLSKEAPQKTVSFEEAWLLLVAELKEHKQEFLASVLGGINPKLDEKHYFELEVHNEAHERAFESEKQEIIGRLRQLTGIFTLDFVYKRIELTEEEARPVTSVDKFAKMAEKNPILLEFAKRFDLDIQY